jgi:prophage regulatory protein
MHQDIPGVGGRAPQPRLALRIIDKKELRLLVPYTSQHIARLEAAGLFPVRIRLGQNRVGWIEAEVQEWIQMRMRERDNRKDNTED